MRIFMLVIAISLPLAASAAALGSAEDPVVSALTGEMTRTLASWKGQDDAPYYLGYRVTDTHRIAISARYGAIGEDTDTRSRELDVSARVGTPALDSTQRA